MYTFPRVARDPLPNLIRYARVVFPLSVLGLVVSLRLAPVAPSYLLGATLVGGLWTFLLSIQRRHHARPGAWLFGLLSYLVIVLGLQFTQNLSVSDAVQRSYASWLLLQYLAIVLAVACAAVLVSRPTNRRTYRAAFLLVTTVVLAWTWYCWQQSRLLLPPRAAQLVVDEDAPPGARKITMVAPGSATSVLEFYRQALPQRGWTYSCSLQTHTCLSNIRVAANTLHDVYHRTGADQRGPSFEILVEPTDTTTTVTIYDQTRGAPPPLSSHFP